MKRAVVALVLVVGLLGCGDSSDDVAPTEVSAPSTSPAAAPGATERTTTTTTSPPARAARRDDPKVRRQVEDIDEDFLKEYTAEVAALDAMGGKTRASGEERIDDVIDQACEEKAKGFPGPTDEELGSLIMLVGATLAENGHDVAGLLDDVEEGNRKVADLVDC